MCIDPIFNNHPHREDSDPHDPGRSKRIAGVSTPCTEPEIKLCGNGGKTNELEYSQRMIAVIPARGGSKGLPRKNAKMLCGKPLVAYSIETALHTPGIDRVIVSTDDEEIAEISRAFGAEVPFLRPKNLADDRAVIGSALSHLRSWLYEEGYRYGGQVALYPTHPFRSSRMMVELVAKLREGYSHVVAGKVVVTPELGFVRIKASILIPLQDAGSAPGVRRYLRNYGTFLGRNFCVTGLPKTYFHRLNDPVEFIDIDTLEDFLLAEEVIRSGLYGEYLPCKL
jgi:hypothetical protein